MASSGQLPLKRRPELAASWNCFALSAILASAYLIADSIGDEPLMRLMNLLGPVTLGVGCAICAVTSIRSRKENLWSPLPWFCLASIMFFGLGPLVYRFGPESLSATHTQSGLIEWIMWRTNLLNAVGTASVFFGYYQYSSLRRENNLSPAASTPDDTGSTSALIVFLGLGLPVKYLLALPYEFGQTDDTLAGSILSLSQLTSLGLLILAYKARRFGGFWIPATVGFFTTEVVVSGLQFSKASVVLTLICPALGFYLARPSLKPILISAPMLFIAYVLVTPVVSEGRLRIARQNREGLIYQASLIERIDIGADILKYGVDSRGSTDRAWWQRLCYASAQIFAMQLYDTGMPGDSFLMSIYTFIPRVIWKDKPIITDVGVDFTELMYGTRTSSTGIGIYGEAYWNGGWLLVIASAVGIGAFFRILERSADRVVARPLWLLLPCAFLGIKMGLRIDGWFAADYVGSAVIYYVYYKMVCLARTAAASPGIATASE